MMYVHENVSSSPHIENTTLCVNSWSGGCFDWMSLHWPCKVHYHTVRLSLLPKTLGKYYICSLCLGTLKVWCVSDRKVWVSIPAVMIAGGGWALTNVPVYSDMNEVTK